MLRGHAFPAKRRGNAVATGAIHTVKSVPGYCYNCVAGPDLLTVKVVDGVATEILPNFAAADIHPGNGRVCVRALG
jgi:phenylacetyl-CoA:acceptor oxidoreductase